MPKRLKVIFLFMIGLVSCAKVAQENWGDAGEVRFVAWNYKVATRIDGPGFPHDESFGAYAWLARPDGPVFMNDETVNYRYEEETWKPENSYYWPVGEVVDFFCYYPAHMAGIEPGHTQLRYTGIDVHAMQQDILYSDMSTRYAAEPERVEGEAASGREGVPALFHHALAKVQVKILLYFGHKAEQDGTVTDWDVSIGNVSLGGIRRQGDCVLNQPPEGGPGPVAWELPVNEDGCHVWTDDGTVVSVTSDLGGVKLVPGERVTAIEEFYVLPQMLISGEQTVSVDMRIRTIRNGLPLLDESFTVTRDLRLKQLPAWQMSQSITYVLGIYPVRGTGSNPLDPDNPFDPNDPDLSDAEITFDPATGGWENIGLETSINL